jgi:RNA polymerase sigma factor (sigma-70 family)
MKPIPELFETYKATPSKETLLELLQGTQDSVFNISYQVLQNQHDAEDASQMALIKIANGLDKISTTSHLRGWIYRVSLNTALDLRRKLVRQHEQEEPEQGTDMIQQSENTPEIQEILHEQISQLDSESSALIIEHYFEKRTLNDLAQEQQVSTSAIWQKLQKAIGQLKQALHQGGYASAIPFLEPYLESITPISIPTPLVTSSLLKKISSKAFSKPTLILGLPMIPTLIIVSSTLALAGGLLFSVIGSKPKVNTTEVTKAVTYNTASTKTSEISTNSDIPPRSRIVFGPSGSREPSSAIGTKSKTRQMGKIHKDYFEVGGHPDESSEAAKLYLKMLINALSLSNDAARWEALRQLDIPFTDEEFSKIALKDSNLKNVESLFFSIIKYWIVKDPKTAATWALSHELYSEPDPTLDLIMRLWTQKDRNAAQAFVQSLPESEYKSRIQESLVTSDPEAMAKEIPNIANLPKGERRNNAVEAWAKNDPRAAFEWAQQLTDAEDKKILSHNVLYYWAQSDPNAALAVVTQMNPDEKKYFMAVIAGAISEKNPEKAFDLIQLLPEGKDRESTIYSIFRRLSKLDSQALTGYLQKLKNDQDLYEALKTIGIEWVDRDFKEAVLLGDNLKEEKVHNEYISHLVQYGAKNHPTEAAHLLETLPLENLIDIKFRPSKDTDLSTGLYSEANALCMPSQATSFLLHSWAQQDPLAALAWVEAVTEKKIPEDDKRSLVRASFTSSIFQMWAQQDLQAARQWLSQAPLSLEEKEHLEGYVQFREKQSKSSRTKKQKSKKKPVENVTASP